jgi:hypothetical protein
VAASRATGQHPSGSTHHERLPSFTIQPRSLLPLVLAQRWHSSRRQLGSDHSKVLRIMASRTLQPDRNLSRPSRAACVSKPRPPQHLHQGCSFGQIAIVRAAPTLPSSPRFRALALFERLPSARADGASCRRPKTCTHPEVTSGRWFLARLFCHSRKRAEIVGSLTAIFAPRCGSGASSFHPHSQSDFASHSVRPLCASFID